MKKILFCISRLVLSTLERLEEKIDNNHIIIMSAISDFAAKQKAFNDRLSTAIDGLVSDVKSLNDKITELQNSPGTITPEDQALLDGIQAQSDALVARAEALDAQTPPVVPPVV